MHVVFKLAHALWPVKDGLGASGRVLPHVTVRFRVQVVVSSHCTGEGKVSLTLFSRSHTERELSALSTTLCMVARGHWVVAVFSYRMHETGSFVVTACKTPSKMCLYLLPLKFEAMVHLGITAMPYILAEMKNVRTPNKVA